MIILRKRQKNSVEAAESAGVIGGPEAAAGPVLKQFKSITLHSNKIYDELYDNLMLTRVKNKQK